MDSHFIQQKKSKFAKTCFSIAVSLIQLIYICWGTKRSHHSILDNTEQNNIPTENNDQEIFQKFMQALCVYVTCSLTLAYLEVIPNIKC